MPSCLRGVKKPLFTSCDMNKPFSVPQSACVKGIQHLIQRACFIVALITTVTVMSQPTSACLLVITGTFVWITTDICDDVILQRSVYHVNTIREKLWSLIQGENLSATQTCSLGCIFLRFIFASQEIWTTNLLIYLPEAARCAVNMKRATAQDVTRWQLHSRTCRKTWKSSFNCKGRG